MRWHFDPFSHVRRPPFGHRQKKDSSCLHYYHDLSICCLGRAWQSCTSGRAGGLICEPLKAVWPAYAGIVTRISLVDRASYLLSLVPLCTLESGLHPAPPLTRNSPSPKSSAPQSSSPDP